MLKVHIFEVQDVCHHNRGDTCNTPFVVYWLPHNIVYAAMTKHQGPILLTWFNFNPSMDK